MSLRFVSMSVRVPIVRVWLIVSIGVGIVWLEDCWRFMRTFIGRKWGRGRSTANSKCARETFDIYFNSTIR